MRAAPPAPITVAAFTSHAALPALAQPDERLTAVLGSPDASGARWSRLREVRLAVREALAADDLDCVGP